MSTDYIIRFAACILIDRLSGSRRFYLVVTQSGAVLIIRVMLQ